MRRFFAILIAITLSSTSVRALDYDALSRFAQSICGDIPEGKLNKNSIQGGVRANIGIVSRIIFGSAGVNASSTEEFYKGIPFDKLPERIPTMAMCKSELIKILVRAERGDILEKMQAEQARTAESMLKRMDFSTAIAILDRSIQSKNGSSQGQAVAIEHLISLGHSYSGANFSGVSFERARMQKIDLRHAELHFSILSSADLSDSNLNESDLRFAIVDSSILSKANLAKSFAPFISAKGAIFRGANLSQSNFFGADFRGADLRGADLTGASFAFADLRGADLREANLKSAYLSGASLTDANLEGALFNNTDLLAAKFQEDKLSMKQKEEICRRSEINDDRLHIEFIERWPSDRFPSGYEFDVINEYRQYFYFKQLKDKSLLPCRVDSLKPVGFSSISWIRLHLDRAYLEKIGRRKAAREKLLQLHERLDSYDK